MPKVKRVITTTITVKEVEEAVRTYLKMPKDAVINITVGTETHGYGHGEYDSHVCKGATATQTLEEEI
jgi:hypothetical protein